MTTERNSALAAQTKAILGRTALPIRRSGVTEDPQTFAQVWAEVPPIFLEVELDTREGVAPMLVGPLVDDAIPGGYYVDRGRRVRWQLAQVLPAEAASRLVSTVQAARKQGGDAMPAQIQAAVEALADNYAEVCDRIGRLAEDGSAQT